MYRRSKPTEARRGLAGAALLLATTSALGAACSVTWREPQIQPLDPTRQYAVPVATVCDAILAALASLEFTVEQPTAAQAAQPPAAASTACLLPTETRRLPERGDDVNHLRKVAYVSGGDVFSHGRVAVTASARQSSGELTRVRLTARIEGYDAGYRVLRSNGLIEATLFDLLQARLGVAAVE